MAEEVEPNKAVVRLRELITTGHLLRQAQDFGFIDDKFHKEATKKLNDEAHKVINSIISTIAGE